MNVAILSALCMLSVVGGVYFLERPDQTRVDVTIFAPREFLGNTSRIFFNYHMDTEVVDTIAEKDDSMTGTGIKIFGEHVLVLFTTRSAHCRLQPKSSISFLFSINKFVVFYIFPLSIFLHSVNQFSWKFSSCFIVRAHNLVIRILSLNLLATQ